MTCAYRHFDGIQCANDATDGGRCIAHPSGCNECGQPEGWCSICKPALERRNMNQENRPVRALVSEDRYWELGDEGIAALRAEEDREAGREPRHG